MKEIVFTGRNVPIEELSSATGKSVQFIKRGLRDGVFDFGYALKCENSKQYRYFTLGKLKPRNKIICLGSLHRLD